MYEDDYKSFDMSEWDPMEIHRYYPDLGLEIISIHVKKLFDRNHNTILKIAEYLMCDNIGNDVLFFLPMLFDWDTETLIRMFEANDFHLLFCKSHYLWGVKSVDDYIASLTRSAARKHGEEVVPAVEEALKKALDGIDYVGSFEELGFQSTL